MLPLPDVGTATLALALVDDHDTRIAGRVATTALPGESSASVAPEGTAIHVPAGWPLMLRAEAPGHGPASLGPLWLMPGSTADHRCSARGRRIEGIVRGAAGALGPSAELSIALAGAAHPFGESAAVPVARATTTAAAPSFRLAGVPKLPVELSVAADGYANQAVSVAGSDDALDLELTLVRPEELHGLVLDRAREPIEGARLVALSSTDQPSCSETTRSLQDGTFRFTHLAPGFYTVRASADAFVAAVKTDVGTGAPDLRFTLEPAGELCGTSSGAPLEVCLFRPQASGDAVTPGAMIAQHGVLGTAGRFCIPGLAPGSILVQVRDEAGWYQIGPLAISSGDVTELPQPSRPASGQIAGTVQSARGQPLAALVRLVPAGQAVVPPAPLPLTLPPCLARADPSFLLAAIAPGEYQLEVLASGFVPVRQAVLVTAGVNSEAGTITLHPAADVIATAAGKLRDQELSLELVRGSISMSPTREAPNRFAFRNVAPGTYELRVFRAGAASESIFASRPLEQRAVTVAEGPGTVVEIELGD
ncbi:MAG: carboxypeptidase-like regulatory domain-containing protein [Planctomycetota bacterium]